MSACSPIADAAEDVPAFAGDGCDVRFTRLAVTLDQIERRQMPPAAPKPLHRRSFAGGTVQVEATPLDMLAGIVLTATEGRLDRRAFAAVLEEKREAREWAVADLLPALRSLPR
jgi:hypothetical protein